MLSGTSVVDVDAATESIRYPLRWHHLALVLWYAELSTDGDELPRIQRFVRELADAADTAARPLFAAADRVNACAWLPYRSLPVDLVGTVRGFARDRAGAPCIAIGTPGDGTRGLPPITSARSGRAGGRARSRHGPSDGVLRDRSGTSAAALLCGDVELQGRGRGDEPARQFREVAGSAGGGATGSAYRRGPARGRDGIAGMPVVRGGGIPPGPGIGRPPVTNVRAYFVLSRRWRDPRGGLCFRHQS
ncbi:hypothetical protein [Nocardia xishanensis]